MTVADGTAWRSRSAAAAVTLVYAAIVIVGAAHHEPWRDEVVPLSIARDVGSLRELVAALRFEGHPILWYLVLRCLYAVVGSTWILKAASIASAVGAVFLLNRGPLAWWVRLLFTFSFYPLYQYSVVSRGYGLEMLLLFAFCAAFPRRRERPILVALLLAGLANTEAFGFIVAVAAGAMLVVEAARGASRGAGAAGGAWRVAIVVYVAGLAAAAAVALPASAHPLAGFAHRDVGDVAAGVVGAIVAPAAHAPHFFGLPPASLLVWAYFVYLAPTLPVLCFALVGFVGIEVLFDVVYGPGAPWHVGNLVLVLVATMWLDAAEGGSTRALSAGLTRARLWLGRGLAVAVVVLFAEQVVLACNYLRQDLAHDHSANRRLAELLHADPSLAGAVVMGEPDMPLWSLPYYAENRVYLAREQVYRAWGVFGPGRARAYDLEALLETARRVRERCACPVVVTLGRRLDALGTFTAFPRTYAEEAFTVTAVGARRVPGRDRTAGAPRPDHHRRELRRVPPALSPAELACDGGRREARTVEGSAAGPTAASRSDRRIGGRTPGINDRRIAAAHGPHRAMGASRMIAA